MQQITGALLLLITICISSCGSGKELKESQAKSDSLGGVINQLNSQVDQCNSQVSQLKVLQSANDSMITRLKNQNAVVMQEAYDCRRAKEAAAGRMEELNQALAANGLSMKEIQRKVADTLNEFANAGVEVSYKSGVVDISMQDDLLFNAGSARLGKKGKEALAVVARVLNEYPNLKIYVIGNTDSIQVTKGFTDNWTLSTERANSVVRVLRDQYQVTMDRVTSGGRAQYNPVAENITSEGRAKNRRTDIILNPDLSGLWDLIYKQQ